MILVSVVEKKMKQVICTVLKMKAQWMSVFGNEEETQYDKSYEGGGNRVRDGNESRLWMIVGEVE